MRPAGARAVRGIAAFEAFKAVLVLLAGFGLLHGLHHDLREVLEQLIRHAHLDPDGHFPRLFLQRVDQLQHANLLGALLAAAAYVALRLFEAVGLWYERPWGEWLGALSGAIYLPIELSHLIARPGVLVAAVLAFNVAVIVFLVQRIRSRRSG